MNSGTTGATDKTMPDGPWEFDAEVAAVFDDMLRRSIPQIEVMREAVTALALEFARPKTEIVDLGCAQGEAIAPLVEKLFADCTFIGTDVSEPMLASARARFEEWIEAGIVRFANVDLRHDFPPARPASVILAILTMQFIPVEYRFELIERIHERLIDGGAFILVEKVLGAGALDRVMVDNYLRHKLEAGYSREEIDRKRLSLEGVLVPMAAQWTENMLATAGFRPVDCFWRWMNFAGWIAVKR